MAYQIRLFSTVLVISSLLFSCAENNMAATGERQTVKIGLALQPAASLFFIAQEKGYFKKQSLDVVMTHYPSGKRALNEGLLVGKEDLITTAEAPFVFSSFTQKQLRVISSLFVADNVNRIIARRDAGIEKPSDLKGKRIATQSDSAVHYFLSLFLLEHNIQDNEVLTSYMKAEALPLALAKGSIDAFSMREPYISQAKKMLGDNAIIFDAPGIYNQVELLVSNEKYIQAHPAIIKKILTALLEAQKYARNNPLKSDKIVSTNYGVTLAQAEKFRLEMKHRIALEQSTLILIEDIGRWAIKGNQVEADELPDYLAYFYYAALESINQKRMTIIH